MERECLSSSRERNRKEKIMERQRDGGQTRKKDLLMLGRSPVGSYEEQGREERRKVY